MSTPPTLRRERQLLREITDTAGPACLIAGIDEGGRGAVAGPGTGGVGLSDVRTRTAGNGVWGSRLPSRTRRAELVDPPRPGGIARGVGHARSLEIDALGINAALALAGLRALDQCEAIPDVILLDGRHDWLSPPQDLFSELCRDEESRDVLSIKRDQVLPNMPRVHTVIGGDMTCASIAAASVLAKVERDAIMTELAADPAHAPYGWDGNKGYGAAQHLAALQERGSCDHHRQSWDFPCGPFRVECGAPSTQIQAS